MAKKTEEKIEQDKELASYAKSLKLNAKQTFFAELYILDKSLMGNGVQCYVEAYDFDTTKKGWYKTCKANASRLLTNANLLKYMDKLLEFEGFNDQFVDKQLLFLITQNAELGTKAVAIKHYNDLRARVIKKVEVDVQDKRTLKDISKMSYEELQRFAADQNTTEAGLPEQSE